MTPQKTNTETIKQEVAKKQPVKDEIKKEEPKKEEIKNETPVVSENKKPSNSNTNSNNSSNSNTNSSDKIYYVVIGNCYYHIKKDCKFIKGGSVESTSNISGKFTCNCVKY